jgi:hypothetical protein
MELFGRSQALLSLGILTEHVVFKNTKAMDLLNVIFKCGK